jgi:hypothetical protein
LNRSIVVGLLPLMLFVAAPARAEQPTLALGGVELASTLHNLESEVIASLEQGLRRAGAEFKAVKDAASVVRQPICETAECARDAGSRLGVGFVAFAQIESSSQAFTITVKILRSQDGAELSRESLTCGTADPCAPIAQSARTVALEAGRKAKNRFGEPAAPVPLQATPPPEIAEVEPIPPSVEPVAIESTTQTQHESIAAPIVSKTHIAPGWFVVSALAATGAIVAGTVMIGQDGDCSETVGKTNTCDYHHSGGLAGIALVSGGTLLMAASAYGYLRWGRDSGAPSVALTHNAIVFTGRF